MRIDLSRFIGAPVDEVFAFFDDPANTVQLSPHAIEYKVVDTEPDGRRTFDIVMGAATRRWMQTIEQVVREPPARLVTRGGTWTTDRSQWLMTLRTDRRFSAERDGTRVDVTLESELDHPFRRPLKAIQNWLQRAATRTEFDRQLALIAARIEGIAGPDLPSTTPSGRQPT